MILRRLAVEDEPQILAAVDEFRAEEGHWSYRFRPDLPWDEYVSLVHGWEDGIDLPDGRFTPANVVLERTNRGSTWLRLTILDGRNRVIRRAFEALGHPVCRLIRVAVGEVTLGAVPEGAWRMLSRREVNHLLQQTGQFKSGEK